MLTGTFSSLGGPPGQCPDPPVLAADRGLGSRGREWADAGVEAGMQATLSWAGVGDAASDRLGLVPTGDGHGRDLLGRQAKWGQAPRSALPRGVCPSQPHLELGVSPASVSPPLSRPRSGSLSCFPRSELYRTWRAWMWACVLQTPPQPVLSPQPRAALAVTQKCCWRSAPATSVSVLMFPPHVRSPTGAWEGLPGLELSLGSRLPRTRGLAPPQL